MFSVYFLFGMLSRDIFIKYTKYTIDQIVNCETSESTDVPFVFMCKRCGSVLYRDPKPVLRDRTYSRKTYLEGVVDNIGGKCPYCDRALQVLPTRIEVSASEQIFAMQEKKQTLDPVFAKKIRAAHIP
jgi:hypothetical protein